MSASDKLMDNFTLAILAVIIIPIADQLANSANVTGVAKTVILLLATFLALGVLFAIVQNFRHTK